MAAREHRKTKCPFCTWYKRSFYLPEHLLIYHSHTVTLLPFPSDHCIKASVQDKKEEIVFCSCLTCGRGALGDGVAGNSARWVSMHSTQTECKKAHNSALEEFKTARVTMPAIAEQIITSTPTIRELLEETYIIDLTNLSDDNCTSTRELHEYLHAKGVMSSEAKVGRELAKLGLVGFSKKKEGKTIRLWSGIQSDTSSSTKLLHMKHVVPQPVISTSTGYVYCFANESMPGILKIGMTTRTPLDRLEEANSSDTWKPPTPYTVELAKSVVDPKSKENTIHKLLEKYSEKIHDRREFFRISVDDVRLFFDLMDGEYWTTSPTQEKSNTKRQIKKKASVAPKN